MSQHPDPDQAGADPKSADEHAPTQAVPTKAPAPRSRARMLELVFPKDTNYLGTAFGGFLLSLMDKAASVAAVRHAGGAVVTARMDGVDFRMPLRVGDAVALDARVVKVGRSSMTIRVDVYREHMASGEQELATTGTFVFVAVYENGKPRPVPALPDIGNDEAWGNAAGRP